MRPSEHAIAISVDRLCAAPGGFQRLAEMYVQVRFPELCTHLVPSGRNARERTVKGWPDAYSISSTGKYVAVEMTSADAAVDHLKDDLKRITSDVETFIFIAWANEPPPEKLAALILENAPQWFSLDRLHLVFRKQLTRELTHQRYAALWVELNVGASSSPFIYVDPVHTPSESDILFGSLTSGFSPSREEYVEGNVHVPDLLPDVLRALEGTGWALVHGRGAAGKTVLALQVALSPSYRASSTYYLSLEADSDHVLLALAKEVYATRAAENTLFIIDDTHLNPQFAASFWHYWHQSAPRSRLLLLGRLSSPLSARKGTVAPFAHLQSEALRLEVKPRDLLGIVDRLAKRRLGQELEIPHNALVTWQKLFGGDLLAFSTAVMRRLRYFAIGAWDLREDDSRDYIVETYLEKMDADERVDLITIACLAELELSTPAEALQRRPRHSLLSGLVLIRSGTNSNPRYALVHPGMGRLLLAACQNTNPDEILTKLACKFSILGVQIVGRLVGLERLVEARTVLTCAFGKDHIHFYESCLQGHLAGLTDCLTQFSRVIPVDVALLDGRVVEMHAVLMAAVLRTPLDFLVRFLKDAKYPLPRTKDVVLQAVGSPLGLSHIRQRGLISPTGEFISWLRYVWETGEALDVLRDILTPEYAGHISHSIVEQEHLGRLLILLREVRSYVPEFHRRLDQCLRGRLYGERLDRMFLRTDLGSLLGFLRGSGKEYPWLWHRVRGRLATPDLRVHLQGLVDGGPIDVIGPYMAYISSELPELHEFYASHLTAEKTRRTLEKKLWLCSPGQIQGFLAALEVGLPELHDEVLAYVLAEFSREKLLFALNRAPLAEFVGLIRYVKAQASQAYEELVLTLVASRMIDDLRRRVANASISELNGFVQLDERIVSALVADLDAVVWWEMRAMRGEGLIAFPIAVKIAEHTSTPQRLVGCAVQIIETTKRADWERSVTYLQHLAHALHLGYQAAPNSSNNLLTEVITPAWLGPRYVQESIQSTAASLFRIWVGCESAVYSRFVTKSLTRKISASFQQIASKSTEELTYAIELLGSFSLYDADLDLQPRIEAWPDYRDLARVVTLWLADPNTRPCHYELQFGLGLRELARICPTPQFLSHDSGRDLLKHWSSLVIISGERHTRIKDLTWSWLIRCSMKNWILLSEPSCAGAMLRD